jgi:hypothetical protein
MPGRAAKKSTTPAKSAPKTKGQRYDYTELGKVSVTSSDTHHVYGVIVDATFPYKTNNEKFICSLKIVDPSLNGKEFASVVIYAKRFENLPIVHRLGDIIRLHRASLRMYKGHRQFNVTTHWHGSWALFSTDPKNALGQAAGNDAPVSFSGQRSTFEKHEQGILSNLRKWASTYFSAGDAVIGDRTRALNKVKGSTGDFDVNARITNIHELDEYTNELRLRDTTGSSWHTIALKLKFPHLSVGQAIRIRSATWDETSTSKNVLALSHYSNITTFIGSSKVAKGLSKVSEDDKENAAELAHDHPSHAITVSEVDAKHAGLHHTNLNELFHQNKTSGTFRTSFFVTHVDPSDHNEATKSWDKKNKKTGSAKGSKSDLIWQVQLIVKDASTFNNANQYRILNYSHEGLGHNFFGKPADFHSDAKARAHFDAQVANLTKFNVWVDAVVELRNGWYYIKDTTLKI